MLKIAKWTLTTGVGTSAGVVMLDSYDYINLTNYSMMRAVRTGITTVKTIVDYKWSLKNLNPGTSEYDKAKSQVCIRYMELIYEFSSYYCAQNLLSDIVIKLI